MKSLILSILFASLVFSSCKKTRTCACSVSGTTTTTNTPRNGGSPTVNSSPVDMKTDQTYPSITKKELRQMKNCNSRTVTTVRSYPTTGSNASEIIDVFEETIMEYTCSIQ